MRSLIRNRGSGGNVDENSRETLNVMFALTPKVSVDSKADPCTSVMRSNIDVNSEQRLDKLSDRFIEEILGQEPCRARY